MDKVLRKHKVNEMKKIISVSVIIPCYNSAATIKRALESVVLQTKLPAEVILVDDCSSDNGATVQCLYKLKTKFAKIFSIKIIELERNQGAASARNAGWEKAEQRYIAFLDSDDVWHCRKLELQYDFMEENKQTVLSGHLYKIIDKIDVFNQEKKLLEETVFLNKYGMIFKNSIATRTVMIQTNSKYRFQAGKRYSEDYLLWLQVIYSGEIALIKAVLAGTFKADYGVEGLSAHLWKMEKGELHTYLSLYRDQLIGHLLLASCSVWSLMKFFRRVLKINFLRKGRD